jgi:hypothetical protein
MTAVQISVFLENKSGRLAELTRALADGGINIRALSLAETIDYGVLRLIVDRPEDAKQALAKAGFTVTETQVIAVELADQPGGLAGIVDLLMRNGLNIEYCYAFVAKRGDNAVVILRIDDAARAIETLRAAGAHVLTAAEVSQI